MGKDEDNFFIVPPPKMSNGQINAIAATLGSLIAGGAIYTVAEEYADHRAAAAIRSAPADILSGTVAPPPINPDKLAEILAKDSAARERWSEIKQMMDNIERHAAALEGGAAPAASDVDRWKRRIESQQEARGGRTPGAGESP